MVDTYKMKFNRKHGQKLNQPNSLEDIAKLSGTDGDGFVWVGEIRRTAAVTAGRGSGPLLALELSAVMDGDGASQPSAAAPLVSGKLALRVTEQHTAADEPVLHTPLSTAPHGASRPSAASPLESKKLALHAPICAQLRLNTCAHSVVHSIARRLATV